MRLGGVQQRTRNKLPKIGRDDVGWKVVIRSYEQCHCPDPPTGCDLCSNGVVLSVSLFQKFNKNLKLERHLSGIRPSTLRPCEPRVLLEATDGVPVPITTN